ncbi:MAG TPA: 6-phosphofructokinase [Candidatus Bathyarchaeota archaeon]|nr:6-phosphofructokinase [Candidatus Bathyarchaeota archaeon]
MKRIGVVTAGGDAPGMNAAIRAIVRSAAYNGLEVIGIERGYAGLIEGKYRILDRRSVSGIINLGGTILRTIRCKEIRTDEGIEKAAEFLKKIKIEGLIAIGGDGTFRGASRLYRASGIPMIGVPATIDNDVSGTDTTIGFDTAVNTALNAIDKIRDTATSHERIFIVEVMGRRRGFLALEVGLAGGAEIILIPEIKLDLSKVCERIKRDREEGKISEIIVMAEGAGDSRLLTEYIAEETGYNVRLAVLGHIQRGGVPTARSRILACEFGCKAVELLLTGEQKRMVGIKGGEITSVDLDYSWMVEKKIDLDRHKLAEILSL